MERLDPATLQYVMRSMTTNDRQLQREVLTKYVTDDVKFIHFLGDVQGKDAYYGVYRAAVTGIDYKLKFIDMVINEHLVVSWVDLNIKLAPFFLKRYHAPTIVMLRIRKGDDGLYRICEQIDHHSIFTFMWALGWPFSTFADRVTRPITGWLLSTSGWTVDTLQDLTGAAWVVSTSMVGKAAKAVLPASVLEAVPNFIAQPLGLKPGTQGVTSPEAESAAIQQVLTSINGLLQSAGLGDIQKSIAALGGDDGLSTTSVTDSAGLKASNNPGDAGAGGSSVVGSAAAGNGVSRRLAGGDRAAVAAVEGIGSRAAAQTATVGGRI